MQNPNIFLVFYLFIGWNESRHVSSFTLPSVSVTHRKFGRHRTSCIVFGSDPEGSKNDNKKSEPDSSMGEDDDAKNPSVTSERDSSDAFRRFTNPVIDDPYLPLSDVLVAQIMAPSLQVAWLSWNRAPSPSWLKPIFDTNTLFIQQGSLIAPTLIHGAALASCWIVGALAARAYQRDAILPRSSNSSPRLQERRQQFTSDGSSPSPSSWNDLDGKEEPDYSIVLLRVVQAGAFATGVLVLATQLDLWTEFQGRYVSVGDSPETDFRIYLALVEVINDVVFEAICLVTWRLYLARRSMS